MYIHIYIYIYIHCIYTYTHIHSSLPFPTLMASSPGHGSFTPPGPNGAGGLPLQALMMRTDVWLIRTCVIGKRGNAG